MRVKCVSNWSKSQVTFFYNVMGKDHRNGNQAGYIDCFPKTLAHAPDILDMREFMKLVQRLCGERRENAA